MIAVIDRDLLPIKVEGAAPRAQELMRRGRDSRNIRDDHGHIAGAFVIFWRDFSQSCLRAGRAGQDLAPGSSQGRGRPNGGHGG